MKELYNQFRFTIIKHPKYEGVICGYNEEHFLLAIETDNPNFFKSLTDSTFVEPEYTDSKFRYAYEDEECILRQMKTINTVPNG